MSTHISYRKYRKDWNNAIFSNTILEVIKVKSETQNQIPYDITYMWKLKYDTNDLIYERETDAQI